MKLDLLYKHGLFHSSQDTVLSCPGSIYLTVFSQPPQ